MRSKKSIINLLFILQFSWCMKSVTPIVMFFLMSHARFLLFACLMWWTQVSLTVFWKIWMTLKVLIIDFNLFISNQEYLRGAGIFSFRARDVYSKWEVFTKHPQLGAYFNFKPSCRHWILWSFVNFDHGFIRLEILISSSKRPWRLFQNRSWWVEVRLTEGVLIPKLRGKKLIKRLTC